MTQALQHPKWGQRGEVRAKFRVRGCVWARLRAGNHGTVYSAQGAQADAGAQGRTITWQPNQGPRLWASFQTTYVRIRSVDCVEWAADQERDQRWKPPKVGDAALVSAVGIAFYLPPLTSQATLVTAQLVVSRGSLTALGGWSCRGVGPAGRWLCRWW